MANIQPSGRRFFNFSQNCVRVWKCGNEAIVITRDDDVYALGSNGSSCLGVGDAQSCLHPRKVEALSKKNIVSLACGRGPHVLAVSGRYDPDDFS